MTNNRLYLNELTTTTKDYSVAVKVVEKTRPKCWPIKGILYQNLLLEDEKGTKIRGVLFGEQIGLYSDALVYNGHYEISNAPIKTSHKEQLAAPDNHKHLMVSNRLTNIRSLDKAPGPIHPKYKDICEIPKVVATNERYDVMGVVIFVEKQTYNITTQQGKEYTVRELAILDHSTEHPLLIAALNDLASTDCNLLFSKEAKLQLLGITALKHCNYKGFSMASTMSTTFIHSPSGEKLKNLADWRNLNHTKLIEMQERILNGRRSFPNKHKATIAKLLMKQTYNSAQLEKYILKVTIPNPDFDKITTYLGCSECGKQTDTKEGDVYYCTSCLTDNVISLPSATFNCQVTDGTGNLSVTAFTTNAEKILHMQISDIVKMKTKGKCEVFQEKINLIQASQYTIVVAPATITAASNVVEWELQSVHIHTSCRATETTTVSSYNNDQVKTKQSSNDEASENSLHQKYKPNSSYTSNIGTCYTNSTEETATTTLPENLEQQSQKLDMKSGKRTVQMQQQIQGKMEKVRKTMTQDSTPTAETNNPKKKESSSSNNP